MNCKKYKRAEYLIAKLEAAAKREESMPETVPGQSEDFKRSLESLRKLIDPDFSKDALGELRRTVAMVEEMNLPRGSFPDLASWKAQNARVKERLANDLAERKKAFQKIKERDCGISPR
jgi:hypothetical protein